MLKFLSLLLLCSLYSMEEEECLTILHTYIMVSFSLDPGEHASHTDAVQFWYK